VTEGRKRTSIAHEVGHFALDHALPAEGDPASWFKSSCEHRSKRDERDADILAIEHLTPAPMVAPYCSVTPVDLHAVNAIERVFTASPVMSAMRFAELSPEACAAVYSERGAIKWMKPSRTFPTYVAGGKTLARESVAAGYFDRGTLIDVPMQLPACAWLGSSKHATPEREIIEHAVVIPEPGWGGVLSLLWIPKLTAQ
jgi:Zn-dependent peptidase ImmA (M78 family)